MLTHCFADIISKEPLEQRHKFSAVRAWPGKRRLPVVPHPWYGTEHKGFTLCREIPTDDRQHVEEVFPTITVSNRC